MNMNTVWVACSTREFGHVGRDRHLVKALGHQFALTTACGASASVLGIWRPNKSKPKCQECAAKE